MVCPVLQKTLHVNDHGGKRGMTGSSEFSELCLERDFKYFFFLVCFFFFFSDDENLNHTLSFLLVLAISLLISGSSMITSLLHGSRRAEVNTPMQCSESPHTVAHACSANRAVSSQTLYCLHK